MDTVVSTVIATTSPLCVMPLTRPGCVHRPQQAARSTGCGDHPHATRHAPIVNTGGVTFIVGRANKEQWIQ